MKTAFLAIRKRKNLQKCRFGVFLPADAWIPLRKAFEILEQKCLDRRDITDYIGHMITSLRESKAKLSALVALAEAGEEVIITVRGKPKARLSAIPKQSAAGMSGWKKELKSLHRKCGSGKRTADSQAILNELREERC